jgi:hypothetical protein
MDFITIQSEYMYINWNTSILTKLLINVLKCMSDTRYFHKALSIQTAVSKRFIKNYHPIFDFYGIIAPMPLKYRHILIGFHQYRHAN